MASTLDDTTRDAGDVIRIRGARVHNLRNLELDIPRDQMVVITGPSGSGKSSLAFDTLFAEGQRQYIESLSVYARQFLHQLERPDVDLIEGLQPTICIDQRPGNQNPRSTVATVTEIYDYLRLLLARLGEPFCYQCGAPIRQQTPEQIQDALLELPEGCKVLLMAPLVRGRRGQHEEVFEQIRKAGWIRARVDGQVYELDNVPPLAARKNHHIEAIVDRIIIRPGVRARLGESIQQALRHSEGLVSICYYDESASAQDPDPDPDRDQGNGPPGGVWRDRLFSTLYSCPECQISYEEVEPRTFSFNSPHGACPQCEGLGRRTQFDPELVLPDRGLSLAQGAIAAWRGATAATVRKWREQLVPWLRASGADWETPLSQVDDAALSRLLHGDGKQFQGVLTWLEKEFATSHRKPRLEELESFRGEVVCAACQGSRLRPQALAVRVAGRSIHDLVRMSVEEAGRFFATLAFPAAQQPIAGPLLQQLRHRLQFLARVGVDYLTLERSADTLSGGELQRVRLATSIGSGLVGVCYVLDEPSIGLHPRDNQRLIDALRDLNLQGNTVLVVEHDEAMMRQADHLIDMGPGAGCQGGQLVAQGTPPEVCRAPASLTGRYLSGELRIPVPATRRRVARSRALVLEGVTTNNLKDVRVQFPLGVLICVTGVSGSGKSSLINETLAPALIRRLGGNAPRPGPHQSLRGTGHVDKVIQIDQAPIGRTPRSNAATYTGVFDEIRKVFTNTRDARQRGYNASRFSFNVKGGRCEACQGQGLRKIEMNFLPDLYVTCDECGGARFNSATLEVKYKGRSIAGVLDMSVDEASEFFANLSSIHRQLVSLRQVGLGYLPLGQPSTTLSGGEAQRIKLATQLARAETGKTVYLLDEPTTGLHFEDIRKLLEAFSQLVDHGNTVIVIEHNLDVIKFADWVIDLGPEGGAKGGYLLAAGTPEDLAALPDNSTGQFLRLLLADGR
ncbi:MAG: excinuclease ABC subunit UvrA [Pirellulaceae bacterium]|nr:excinuclease ABC subunit UvrA [Pirellulaceae bacterium]